MSRLNEALLGKGQISGARPSFEAFQLRQPGGVEVAVMTAALLIQSAFPAIRTIPVLIPQEIEEEFTKKGEAMIHALGITLLPNDISICVSSPPQLARQL